MADYSDDDLAAAAEGLFQDFMEAAFADPPDLDAANATYAEACELPDDELAARIERLIATLQGAELSLDVIGATRLDERDWVAVVLSVIELDGVPISTPARSLMVFENGRWRDSDCEVGRALILTPEGGAARPSGTPEVLAPAKPALSENPAEHTDEEIARSIEWVSAQPWLAVLEPQPDLERIRAESIAACRTQTDEDLLGFVESVRRTFADDNIQQVEIRVRGVERIDEGRVWFTSSFAFDDISDQLSPALAVFEDGHWRDGDCLVARDPALQHPAEIEHLQRIAYVGEPVRVQFDYEEQPFSLMVLETPEHVSETVVRLPVRITAVTETLDFDFVTYFAYLETGGDAEGNVVEWGEPCEREAIEGLTLVRGGSFDDFICFSADRYEGEEETIPDEPFVRFISFDGEEFVRVVDLTRGVAPVERRTFEPGAVWGKEPVARLGETVSAIDCWPAIPYMELTVPRPAELLTGGIARVRIHVKWLDSEPSPLPLAYLFELAAGPERHGRLHRWMPLTDEADPSAYPDNLAGVMPIEGESTDGFVYFEAPDSEPDSLVGAPTTLLYWSACWPKPLHLSRPDDAT